MSNTRLVTVFQTLDDLHKIVSGEFFLERARVLDEEEKLSSISKLLNNDSLDIIAFTVVFHYLRIIEEFNDLYYVRMLSIPDGFHFVHYKLECLRIEIWIICSM